jgi:cyclase
MKITRREFVGISSASLLFGFLPRGLHGAHLTEVRRNVGIFTARGGTIGWLANSGGMLAVDSQYPDTAQTFLEALRSRGAAPLDALINTHHHGDHTAGNAVLRGAVRRIVAHERVPELQRTAAAGTASEGAQVYPDTTFSGEWSVQLGDETVRAKHFGAAHTAGDCTVHFERADVVHMGDLVFSRAYPFVDRPGGATIRGWVDVLERVAGEHGAGTIYVFGHANPAASITGSRADVLLERDFLSAVLETAGRAIAQGRSREEVLAIERLPAFPDHAPLAASLTLAVPLGAAYDELRGAG